MVHVEQVKRDGFFVFYLRYVFEWVVNLFRYFNFDEAYRMVSYEREAYRR